MKTSEFNTIIIAGKFVPQIKIIELDEDTTVFHYETESITLFGKNSYNNAIKIARLIAKRQVDNTKPWESTAGLLE